MVIFSIFKGEPREGYWQLNPVEILIEFPLKSVHYHILCLSM